MSAWNVKDFAGRVFQLVAQEEPTMIQCPYCGQEKNIRGMGLHVFKIHPEKMDEYRKVRCSIYHV